LANVVAFVVWAAMTEPKVLAALTGLGLTLTPEVDGTSTATGRLLLHHGQALRCVIAIEDA